MEGESKFKNEMKKPMKEETVELWADSKAGWRNERGEDFTLTGKLGTG